MIDLYNYCHTVKYLKKKKVPFAIKFDHIAETIQLIVSVTKKDMFYRANGKVICGNLMDNIVRMKKPIKLNTEQFNKLQTIL